MTINRLQDQYKMMMMKKNKMEKNFSILKIVHAVATAG
jgi:hypothetical protein